MISENHFRNTMLGLADYYGKALSEPLILIYWGKLKKLSDQELSEASSKCIDDLAFFPKINEIMQRVPKRKLIEKKASTTLCSNCISLIKKYPPQ